MPAADSHGLYYLLADPWYFYMTGTESHCYDSQHHGGAINFVVLLPFGGQGVAVWDGGPHGHVRKKK